jgi:hypothetical protein
MKEMMIKVESMFPVWVWMDAAGRVVVVDLLDNVYVACEKDGRNLTPEHYNGLIQDKLGFFDIARTYRLEVV